MPVTPADSNAASEMETDEKGPIAIPDAPWAKYNVKVERPQYTDEQYETHLKSEDWSKEETDYLVDLAIEFDLRWIVISDRYDYKPPIQSNISEDSMAITPQLKNRTLEDLKTRYYDLAAKTMVLHNPLSSMSVAEFSAHEKMTKFDGAQETKRKKYVELLFARPKEEKEEEEYYLRELSRIVANQEKLSQDRKALYERLDAAPSSTRDSMAMYTTSQGLTQLMQTLFTQNKNKELERKGEKRRSLLESGEGSSHSQYGPDRSQRQSLSGVGGNSRLSTSVDPHSAGGARRPLTQQEERKYGVSHPTERLTGGIQFRHERITKAGQAKSGVQTSRIGAALTELKIPPRLMMPTARVVTEYERLIEGIKGLLEVRKVSEKLDGETRVLLAQKELMEKRKRGEDIKEEEGTGEEVRNQEEEEEEEAEKGGTQNDESKVEEENEDDNEDDNEDREEKDEEREDSDDEANQNDSDNSASEEDADGEVDESAIAAEMQELQEDEEGEAQEQVDGDGEDEDMEDADGEGENDDDEASSRGSAAPTAKRSASVVSHVSNRSSKRQKK